MRTLRLSLDLTLLMSKAVSIMVQSEQSILCSEHIAYAFISDLNKKYLNDNINKEEILAKLLSVIKNSGSIKLKSSPVYSETLNKAVKLCGEYVINNQEDKINTAHILAALAISDNTYGGFYLVKYVDISSYILDNFNEHTWDTVDQIMRNVKLENSEFPFSVNMILVNNPNLTEEELESIQNGFEGREEDGYNPKCLFVPLGEIDIENVSGDLIEEKLMNSGVPEELRPMFKEVIANSLEDKFGININKEKVNKSKENKSKENKYKPLLDAFCPCMNDRVNMQAPFIGREKELEDTIQTLCRMKKNNPIHVGEPGVGKTAITEGLVRKIVNNDVPDKLKNTNVYSMDMGAIVAGTKYRGEFEDRLKKVLHAIVESNETRPIVYIDEIHTITSAGNSEGGTNASNILKNYLTEGKVSFIGATTYDEYKKVFSKDKALDRRFNRIDIKEPSRDDCVEIIKGVKSYYENYHGVKFDDKAIENCVDLSIKYLTDKFLPDKAVDLLDEAGAMKNTHPEYIESEVVTGETIEELIAIKMNIPKQVVGKSEAKRVLELKDNLAKRVFGQDEACKIVEKRIKLKSAGLGEDNRPKGSLLFVGPTGVGKTELAKTVADTMGVPLITFNMSEYNEKTSVNKLIGSSAGYVGYEDGGLLVDSIRKNPNCVLLLDEIEKADSAIFNILLQVMAEAELKDNQGRKADFKNVLIIMTSNCGAERMQENTLGFSITGNTKRGVSNIDEELKRSFKPEFLNRITAIVKFNYIDKDTAINITKYKLGKLAEKLTKQEIKVSFHKSAIEYIVEHGVNENYGARELERIIENEIEDLLAEKILTNELEKGDYCSISYNKNGFKINIKTVNLEKAIL